MKKQTISIAITIYESKAELSDSAKLLMEKAAEARQLAYAPYSQFKVGAAILLEDGTIVSGSNQENAAYPSGLCAERVAIFHAGATYPNLKIIQLAICAGSTQKTTTTPVSPCGSCRQSIAEYETKQDSPIEIYFMGETGPIYQSDSVNDLLPLLFNKKLL